MRAIVLDDDRVRLDLNRSIPVREPGEALIRVLYSGVCNTDLELVKGYMGYRGVMGHEFVGRVEEADDPGMMGKRVTGEINLPCHDCGYCQSDKGNHCPNRKVLGILGKDGAFAEYATLPVSNLHIVPDEISDKDAVFTEPLAAAFRIIEQVDINEDTTVMVMGDGKLGLLIAQAMGATGCNLTVAGRHPDRLDHLKQNGINTILVNNKDKTPETEILYDLVVEATGSKNGFNMALDLVRPEGTIALKSTVADTASIDTNRLVINEVTMIGSRCGPFTKALSAMKDGSVKTDWLVNETVPLDNGLRALELAERRDTIKILISMD